jgi:ferritin
MKDYKIIEGFIEWFIKEQNDDCCQKDIMLDSLVRYLEEEKKK